MKNEGERDLSFFAGNHDATMYYHCCKDDSQFLLFVATSLPPIILVGSHGNFVNNSRAASFFC